MDPHVLRFLSHYSFIWWNSRGHLHGPLSRYPREAAFEPFGSARYRGSWITDGNLHALAAGTYAKSSGAPAAGARAVSLIAARLRLQAYALSLNEGFLLVAGACVVGLLLTALLRKSPLNYGHLSSLQPVKEPHS